MFDSGEQLLYMALKLKGYSDEISILAIALLYPIVAQPEHFQDVDQLYAYVKREMQWANVSFTTPVEVIGEAVEALIAIHAITLTDTGYRPLNTEELEEGIDS